MKSIVPNFSKISHGWWLQRNEFLIRFSSYMYLLWWIKLKKIFRILLTTSIRSPESIKFRFRVQYWIKSGSYSILNGSTFKQMSCKYFQSSNDDSLSMRDFLLELNSISVQKFISVQVRLLVISFPMHGQKNFSKRI